MESLLSIDSAAGLPSIERLEAVLWYVTCTICLEYKKSYDASVLGDDVSTVE